MGSVRIPHHILTTQTEPWDFFKSLRYTYQYIWSLHLNFYLRRNLGGYMVGTIMGFPV
jgi:hypothetical protein